MGENIWGIFQWNKAGATLAPIRTLGVSVRYIPGPKKKGGEVPGKRGTGKHLEKKGVDRHSLNPSWIFKKKREERCEGNLKGEKNKEKYLQRGDKKKPK